MHVWDFKHGAGSCLLCMATVARSWISSTLRTASTSSPAEPTHGPSLECRSESAVRSTSVPGRIGIDRGCIWSGGGVIAWGDSRGRVRVGDLASRKEVFRFDAPGPNSADCRRLLCVLSRRPSTGLAATGLSSSPARPRDREEDAQRLGESGSRRSRLLKRRAAIAGGALEGRRGAPVRLRTGEVLLSLPQSDQAVTHAEWSTDARRVVTLEGGKNPRLWDAESGRLLGEFDHGGAASAHRVQWRRAVPGRSAESAAGSPFGT